MPINIEKYRKRLARFKLDKEREDEIIQAICNMMDEFVLAAHGKHPAQQALQERKRKSLPRTSGAVDSGNDKIKESFHNVTSGQGK